jgi:hypothetical protein
MWASGAVIDAIQRAASDPRLAPALPPELKQDADLLSVAVTLAQCSVAIDCSNGSLHYFAVCAQAGICGGSIPQGVLARLQSPEQRALATRQAKLIENAILGKRFEQIGLGG